MNFQPELAAAVMAGRKTVTRRRQSPNPRSPWWEGGCRYRVDQDFAVCPGRAKTRIGNARVVSVREVRLGSIDDSEARAEGFANVSEFVAAWERINGAWQPNERVWRVEFRAC